MSDRYTDNPRHAGSVRRYHTWAVHHQQTVGEHCWQVARIYEAVFGAPTAEVERYIRHHDTAELVVGDPPFPVKADSPALKAEYDALEEGALVRLGVSVPAISDTERARVKVCDLLDMMEHGMYEREMGNAHGAIIVQRTRNAAFQTASSRLEHEDTRAVARYADQQWVRHTDVLRHADQRDLYKR